MKITLKLLFFVMIVFFINCIFCNDIFAQIELNNDVLDSKETSLNEYWWLETLGRINSSKTDFYYKTKDDDKLKNYNFVKDNLKLGYRLFPALSKLPYDIILDLYINSNIKWDINNKELNRLDWNNNYVYGLGIRSRKSLKPYFDDFDFIKDINLDLFYQYLKIKYLSKVNKSITHRPEEDLIYGISFWSSFEGDTEGFDDNFFNRLWAEIGAGYSHRKSNLFVKNFENFNIINASAILGLRTFYKKINYTSSRSFLDIYFRAELEWDLGNKFWNKYEWNNNIKYGPGFYLLNYIYDTKIKTSKFCKVIKANIFLEYLYIDYLDKVKYIPSFRPDNDILIGINFFILFGGKEIE